MGIYSRYVFPRICDRLMAFPNIAKLRGESLATVSGEILEIGFGTGLNLSHYPERVRRITAVDPNPGMNSMARRRITESRISVDLKKLGGESLPFADESFDCVVSTFTLCSIPEVATALEEVHRVLRPGGRFVFLEHGISDDPGVRKWQARLNPLERHLADRCRLDLDIAAIVRQAPFEKVEVNRLEIEGLPRTHGTIYRGVSTKASQG